jgi:hypothetical protein
VTYFGIYETPAPATNASTTLTAWKKPRVVTDANSGNILVGCTYEDAVLTGGTSYPSTGLTLNSGNQVNHNPLLGGESIDISDRAVSGNVEFDLTAAQEATFMGYVESNSLQSIGWEHGVAAGLKCMIFAPGVQFINPAKANLNGKRLVGLDMRLTPVAGNDEVRFIFF